MISGPIFSQKNIGGFHILELYQGATTLFEDSSLWGSWWFPNWRILRLAASHFSSKLTEKMVSWAFGAPKFLGLQQSTSQVATTGFWSECRLTSFCCFCPGYGHLENFNWPWKTMENPAFMDCPLNPLKIGISHWQLKWPAFSKFKTLMSWICFGFPSSVFWQTHFFGWFMACCSKLLLISSQFSWFTSIDGYQFFLATTIFDGHLPPPWNRRSLSSGSYWGEPQRGLRCAEWRFTFWTHPLQPEISIFASLYGEESPKKFRNAGTGKKKNMAISDWNILELASIKLWRWSFHVFPTFLVTSNPWRKNGNSTSNISHPNQGAGARRCPHGTAHCGWHCLGHQNSHKLPADSIAQTLGFWWFSMFFPTKVFCSFFLHSQSIT